VQKSAGRRKFGENQGMIDTTERVWADLKERLKRSKFRLGIRLNKQDKAYFLKHGSDKIRQHAIDFVNQRLAPAQPARDGKQTPYRGHPVFAAQHGTGTCCRGCLDKWHGIKQGVELTGTEREYIVYILMSWLEDKVLQ
jgi:hypothetical protein